MLRKILVCLDGSEFAEALLPYAIERARRFNSKIVLLKVINSNISAYVFSSPGMSGQPLQSVPIIAQAQLDSMIREEEVRDRLYLESVATRLREVSLDVEIVAWRRAAGDGIADAIVTYATEHEVNLIMMAAHRRSFWKRFIYGSIMEAAIRKSAIPILVVSSQRNGAKEETFGEMPQASLA